MDRVEVNLQDILWALKKHLIWIVLSCVIFAVGSYAYTEIFITPVYSTKVSMVVRASQREGNDVTSGELTADNSLTNTYTALMDSRPVCDAVSRAMDGKLTPAAIASMISASRVQNTQVIEVNIRSVDPKLAVEVGNALLETAPRLLTEKAGGEMSTVDAAVSAGLVSPNIRSNVIYGFLAGLTLACAVVILIAVLDTTVWREEDLERAYHFPVLGGVPSMGTSGKKGR